MALITVNETCISCGACAEVCPVDTIKIVDKKPQAVSSFCIACGHCVAVCPVNAIDNEKNPLSAQKQIPYNITFNEETVYYLLRSRRSIRNFKNQTIPQDIIEQLIQIGTFAPTGSNSQGVSYMVVSGEDNIQKLADYTADWMEIESQKGGYGRVILNPLWINTEKPGKTIYCEMHRISLSLYQINGIPPDRIARDLLSLLSIFMLIA